MSIAETSSGDGGSELEWWSHGWCIVRLALSERRPVVLVSARVSMGVMYSAGRHERSRPRLLKWYFAASSRADGTAFSREGIRVAFLAFYNLIVLQKIQEFQSNICPYHGERLEKQLV